MLTRKIAAACRSQVPPTPATHYIQISTHIYTVSTHIYTVSTHIYAAKIKMRGASCLLLGTGLSVLLVILVLGYSGDVDPEPEPVVVHHRYRRSGDGNISCHSRIRDTIRYMQVFKHCYTTKNWDTYTQSLHRRVPTI